MPKALRGEYHEPAHLQALGSTSLWLNKWRVTCWAVITGAGLAAAHLLTYFYFIADDIHDGLNTKFCAPVMRGVKWHWVTRTNQYDEPYRVRVPNFGIDRVRGCLRWGRHGILHNLWVMPWLSVTALSLLGASLGLALLCGPGRRALVSRGQQRLKLSQERADSAAQTKHWLLTGDPLIADGIVTLNYVDFHAAQQEDHPPEHTRELRTDQVSWERSTGQEPTVRFPQDTRSGQEPEAVIYSKRQPEGIDARRQLAPARHRAAMARINQV